MGPRFCGAFLPTERMEVEAILFSLLQKIAEAF